MNELLTLAPRFDQSVVKVLIVVIILTFITMILYKTALTEYRNI